MNPHKKWLDLGEIQPSAIMLYNTIETGEIFCICMHTCMYKACYYLHSNELKVKRKQEITYNRKLMVNDGIEAQK